MRSSFRLPNRKNAAGVQTQENSEGVGNPGSPYPASYAEPPTQEPFQSVDQIPVRGTMFHGVDQITPGHFTDPEVDYQIGDRDSRATIPLPARDTSQESDTDPIPVRVINTGPNEHTRKKFRAYAYVIAQQDAGVNKQLFGRNADRTSISVGLKSIDGVSSIPRVWVGPDEISPNLSSGALPLDNGDSFSSNTTEDVWVMLDPAATTGVMLVVYMEYDVNFKVA